MGSLPPSLRTREQGASLEDSIEAILLSHSTLLYGDTNAGKTFVSMSWPTPIIFTDTESRAENTRLLQYGGDPDIDVYCPVQLRKPGSRSKEVIDQVESLRNLNDRLSRVVVAIENKQFTKGTMVIESLTDVWQWLKRDLMEKKVKVSKNATCVEELDMQPYDWEPAKSQYWRLMMALKTISQARGIYVVFTMRENIIQSDYVKDKVKQAGIDRAVSGYIIGNRETPFFADIILRVYKQTKGLKTCYMTTIEKLLTFKVPSEPIENFNYTKLQALLREKIKDKMATESDAEALNEIGKPLKRTKAPKGMNTAP